MEFKLVKYIHLRCKEEYDEYYDYDDESLAKKWDAILLVSDEGKVMGIANSDDGSKQLLVGTYSDSDNNINLELFRFFADEDDEVYYYSFPSTCSTSEKPFGSVNVYRLPNMLSGIGNCYFDFEKIKGDYNEIVDYYSRTVRSFIDNDKRFNLFVIYDLFGSKSNNRLSPRR